MYKPEGQNSVSPYLVVADLPVAVKFIKQVFGGKLTYEHRRADGRVGHAEMRIDDTVLMIGEMPGGPEAQVHVYVADVDAVFERALQLGATVAQAVAEKGDGDRRGGVVDDCGTTWWIATMIDPRG